jgi:hypothetical protein
MKNMRSNEQLELAARLSLLGDDTFINVAEFAALTGFSVNSIRQRKVSGLPLPDLRVGRLRWHLGCVRAWMRNR